ncbi:hypothetical protein EVA_16304 [gut metagenome]|uniref:Uncharacterized protein n=1 Tax=gut metagenome TaxID=749906 RepID=J9G1C0_9ZZZZ
MSTVRRSHPPSSWRSSSIIIYNQRIFSNRIKIRR